VDVKRRCSQAEPPITPLLTDHQNGEEGYHLLEELLNTEAEMASRGAVENQRCFWYVIVTLASAVSGSSS
jgi:hypothetical protein